jgi:GNAT superfamily N-acetyltransferase
MAESSVIPMTGSSVHLRSATPDDTGRILDLVRLSLGEGRIPRDLPYWTWKHHENPFGESPMLLAESGEGELVGLRVFIRWRWASRGSNISAVRAVDTATHPDWRGQGIFSRLTRAMIDRMRDEGVSLVFNTPNDQSRPGYLKMGWISIGRTSFWVKPLRPLRMVRAIAGNGHVTVDGPVPASDASFSAATFLDRVAGASLDRFLSALHASEEKLVTPRDSDYLRWRYARIPGLSYQAVGELDGRNGALAFFRTKPQSGQRELRFSELLVAPTRQSLTQGANLVREALRGADVDFATAMAAPGTPEQRVLVRCGFVPAPRLGPAFTVRPINRLPNGVNPLKRRSWRAAAGDLEVF